MVRTTMNENREASRIGARIEAVRRRIREAERSSARPPGSVRLIAVGKTQPAHRLRAAWAAGQRDFGESYLQEALPKIAALADLDITWHFIGPIQSNKTRAIAEHFDWVHSVARLKIARRLSEQRPAALAPLNLCLQVNVSGEATKSGASLSELPELAAQVAQLPTVHLRGLMAIPAACTDPSQQRASFQRLREALDSLRRNGLQLDALSMGMSDDLEAAVAEGATLVRIGTAIFGPRP